MSATDKYELTAFGILVAAFTALGSLAMILTHLDRLPH